MKTFFQQNKGCLEQKDFDKENQGKSKANVLLSRHCRVQSTLALNVRRDKSITSTSFQNISSNIISEPIRHLRPHFRLQKCFKGENENFGMMHQPSLRAKFYDERNNSFNTRVGVVVERIKTDSNIPLRNIINIRHPSILNNLSQNLSEINISAYNDSKNIQQIQKQKIPSPQEVPVYLDEIFSYMIQQPKITMTYSAFNFQLEITEKMRSVLLDWIVDVHFKFKLQSESLFLTINLIDLVLERVQIPKNKFQLYGISALFIASKYEEVYSVPHIRDLVYVCDNAYSKQEILLTEGFILMALDFNLVHVSSWRLLGFYQQYLNYDAKNYFLANYIIELAVLEYSTIKYPTNVMACAALYLVNKIRRSAPSWPDKNQLKSTLSEIDIRPCAKELCILLQTCEKKAFQSVKKKYSLPKYMEVARIRIEKRSS